jgi:hypothetical protein
MLGTKSGTNGPLLLLAATAGLSPFLESAYGSVDYGTFTGPDVSYQNVTENPTQLPGPTPSELFGPPVLVGDTLDFHPTDFTVGASGGANEFQDGRLTTNISLISKSAPSVVDIYEGGGWAVEPGTSKTTAQESLLVNELVINSVNGVTVNPIVVTPTITFTDTVDGTAAATKTSESINFASTGTYADGTWDVNASFNLPAALAAAGLKGTVTGMTLDLNDQLNATSETDSSAFIDKKFADVTTSVSVPEPATASAIALTAIGLLGRRSKYRKAVQRPAD